MEKEKVGRLVDAIKLEKSKARSAWRRGVCDYAMDFIENLSWENAKEITACQYCKYKDICFREQKDIQRIKKDKELSYLGG